MALLELEQYFPILPFFSKVGVISPPMGKIWDFSQSQVKERTK